jgi:hypothetical protein|tara:strand:+ start:3659 stop:3913 length:255 start_codon:yes stop_codon:yes gene_type:complete
MAEQTEEELREEFFEGPLSDSMSYEQFLMNKGRGDLIKKGKGRGETMKIGKDNFRGGGLARRKRSIARGCGAIMENRRKKTLYT